MGSVYKITDGKLVYYGSTTQLLNLRLSTHRTSTFNECETRQMNKDDMTIELVEAVEDVKQLRWRERYYIENNECVNKHKRPIINREERLEYWKEYRKKNAETIKKKGQTPYFCECGCVINWDNKARHFKTPKHINNIDE